MNSAFCVAVHALICLNRRQEQLSSEELARSICTNPARVRKIMAGLKRAGLVETKEGNEGGYRFVGDPAALTLDQVARALEVRFVSTNWRGGGVDQPCLEASGMAEVTDYLQDLLDCREDSLLEELDEGCRSRLSEISLAELDSRLYLKQRR